MPLLLSSAALQFTMMIMPSQYGVIIMAARPVMIHQQLYYPAQCQDGSTMNDKAVLPYLIVVPSA